jgi:IS30 family transposase
MSNPGSARSIRLNRLPNAQSVSPDAAEAVKQTIVAMMDMLSRRTYILTVDNGKEFSNHESITQKL